MQMPFMDRRVLYLYILLVQWGTLLHSENVVRTEVAVAGSTINITCHFVQMDLGDVIRWVFNNITITKDQSKRRRHGIDQSVSKAYLEISHVTFEDAGLYKCVRFPKVGNAESNTNRLHVRGDMEVEVDRNVTLHDTITAKCCVRSTKSEHDVPFVWFISNVWSVNDKFGETFSNDTDIMYCRNISIISEQRFHDNFVGCSISPELNVTSKKPLHILYPANVEWIPSTNTPPPIMVDRNQNVTVTCLSDGNPSPSVLLQKKTSEDQWMDLPLIETFWNVTYKYWKFSYNITEETTCTLRCFATNDIGEPSASDVITIEVLVDLMAVILANLKLVVIGCVGFLLLLMVICFLALKKRKRIRYRLSAEANRNTTNSTQNQQNFIRRDMPDLCSHEPIAASQIDTPSQSRKEDYPLEQYQNFQVFDRTETATPDVPLAKFDDGASYGVVKKKRERAPKPELAVSRFDDGANYAVVKKKRIKKPMYKPPPRKVEEEYTNMKYRE